MPVHSDSRISSWVADFNPEFYDKLTSQEYWAYENYSGSQQSYLLNSFSTIDSRLNAYRNVNRKEIVFDLVSAIHGAYSLEKNFSSGSVDTNVYSATKQFCFGEFGRDTLTYPDNYYNDVSGNPPTSSKMASSLSKLPSNISNLIEEEDELIRESLSELVVDIQGAMAPFLFVDPPPPPPGSSYVGKRQIGEFIFNTLGYDNVYRELDVSPLELPPYI